VLASVRSTFVRGLLLLLPLAITWVVLRWVFRLVMGFSAPLASWMLALLGTASPETNPIFPWLTPVIALVLTVGLVMLVGLVGGNYVGRRVIAWFDHLLLKVPLVKWLYGSARQLMDAFVATGAGAFHEVVFVEYPRLGMWCLGFVTAPAGRLPGASGSTGEESVYVFLPTTPNPTSGYTALVPRSQVHPADMTVDEGLKLIVSGGFIAPAPRNREGRRP
jgi:uncharacterized membrane protein